ncbi:ribose-5-phosphate isomerase RpiA [Caballeronia sordidicola]|nr:ribose-5-phosphate isomerase RpiA [Caballeronia sordidicola]
MNQNNMKLNVATAAVSYVLKNVADGSVLGIGTGSTLALFIKALAPHKARFSGTVSSSETSTQLLVEHGFEVRDLNKVDAAIPLYVDGADEIDPEGHMLKGGGAALTREKIIASAAASYLCIADYCKQVQVLGKFPLPVEVIPMAYSIVSKRIADWNGKPVLRMQDGSPVRTDNQNFILDIHGLHITNPIETESTLNQIPGVVTVGLFARRRANILLVGRGDVVDTVIFSDRAIRH